MVEIEFGTNAVMIISLIINGVIIPLFVDKNKKCKNLQKQVDELK